MMYTHLTENLPEWIFDEENNEWSCYLNEIILVVQWDTLTNRYVWAIDAKVGLIGNHYEREFVSAYANTLAEAKWCALCYYRRWEVSNESYDWEAKQHYAHDPEFFDMHWWKA